MIRLSKNAVQGVGKGRNEGQRSSRSSSSEVVLVDRICMGSTIDFPALRPSYSGPKIQIVS